MNKKTIKQHVLILLFSLLMLTPGYTQPPPPPGGSGGAGSTSSGNGNQLGGNAPVGSGLFILLALGATYGAKKYRYLKNKEKTQ